MNIKSKHAHFVLGVSAQKTAFPIFIELVNIWLAIILCGITALFYRPYFFTDLPIQSTNI